MSYILSTESVRTAHSNILRESKRERRRTRRKIESSTPPMECVRQKRKRNWRRLLSSPEWASKPHYSIGFSEILQQQMKSFRHCTLSFLNYCVSPYAGDSLALENKTLPINKENCMAFNFDRNVFAAAIKKPNRNQRQLVSGTRWRKKKTQTIWYNLTHLWLSNTFLLPFTCPFSIDWALVFSEDLHCSLRFISPPCP